MSAIRMDMRCVSSGPLNTDSSAALRVSVLPDLDVTGEFCTRENVIETGTRGAEAWHGRSTVRSRSSPSCDRSKSNLVGYTEVGPKPASRRSAFCNLWRLWNREKVSAALPGSPIVSDHLKTLFFELLPAPFPCP